jgi:hypothetical protein
MPQFDAAGVVEGLECRLTPYADFDDVIPEPSDKQVAEFLTGLKRVMAEAREKVAARAPVDVNNAEQVAKALDDLEPQEFVDTAVTMAELHAALCSGTPSKAQILKVPIRRRGLFYQWLQNEVLSPEAAPGAGNAQAPRLPLRAAG